WDPATGRPLRSVSTPQVMQGFAHPALSPDGTTLAAVADDHRQPTIQLWDVDSGKLLARLRGHTSYVGALAFSPDGRLLASGSWDTTVLLWDVTRARLEHLWAEVASGPDAARRLAADPGKGVAFLKDRLARAAGAEEAVRRLVAKLDDDQFDVRE